MDSLNLQGLLEILTISLKEEFLYFLGGVALAGGMCLIMPKLIEVGSDYLYKKNPPPIKNEDDDWGPEIVKRESMEEQDGEV